MPENAQRLTASELVKSLPRYSLSLISIGSDELSRSFKTGRINSSPLWQYTVIDNDGHNDIVSHAVGIAYERARGFARIGTNPLIALIITPEEMRIPSYVTPKPNIDMQRVLNVLDLGELTQDDTRLQVRQLIEDNIGRIQLMVRRLAESQQLSQSDS